MKAMLLTNGESRWVLHSYRTLDLSHKYDARTALRADRTTEASLANLLTHELQTVILDPQLTSFESKFED